MPEPVDLFEQLSLLLEDNMKLLDEENRRNTFQSWVFGDDKNCNISKLAEAGFYFKEKPDTVQCFLCHKLLDGWEEDDDPWTEHINHAPYCTFAKLNKPEKSLTLYELFDIAIELQNKIIDDLISEAEAASLEHLKFMRKSLMALRNK